MAPKGVAKAAANKQTAQAAVLAKAKEAEEAVVEKAQRAQEAKDKRFQQSNMLTQIKNKAANSDEDAKSFLGVYSGLGRFDAHKTEMLAKWEKDCFLFVCL